MKQELQKNDVQGFLAEKTKDSAKAVIATIVLMALLSAMGLQVSVIAFFLIVAYFIYRYVSRSEFDVKQIFEFYLSANEILRDDERRWFGFEIYEVINRGEYLLRAMPDAPPLVYFTLGALYHYVGSYKEANEHLQHVLDGENTDEKNHLTASPELREYVKTLREIEREPAKAPLTSAAIRALERARRNRANALLEESQQRIQELQDEARINRLVEEMGEKSALPPPAPLFAQNHIPLSSFNSPIAEKTTVKETKNNQADEKEETKSKISPIKSNSRKAHHDSTNQRLPITDVLREVYDDERKVS